ncbi:unnamed protein product [Adineta ricciae]|uniref:G domain-containing protein n=1 Tax=Adineta ricciae TaxID=249248 RepID=A0A813TFS1_ADIRI|nr:unnamed protein product [Adineta ricciae]CAF1106164.1 unnamed protein product [Adineta ricciae]
MPTTCARLFKPQQGYPTTRKVLDPTGRLGSLYNTAVDQLVDRHSVADFQTTVPKKRSICQVMSGDASRSLMSYMDYFGFDNAIRNSIRLRTVTASGVGHFLTYNGAVNQNTRLLYYCYKDRKEEIQVKARKTHQIVLPPQNSTDATHMITKIVWGFEFLCIIQNTGNRSMETIDRLLYNVSNQLDRNRIPLQLTNDDRRLVNQLTNTTIYGTETCIADPSTSLLTVLDRLYEWQRNPNFHQPIRYTMQPLRWLYGGRFQVPCYESNDENPHIRRIDPLRQRIEGQLQRADELLLRLPEHFSSSTLEAKFNDAKHYYMSLRDNQADLEERLHKAIPDVRSHRSKPVLLDNIIADQQYVNLHKDKIDDFLFTLERLLAKATLIDKLKRDRIDYINVHDLRPDGPSSPTNEVLDVILKRSCLNDKHAVILWYSTDRLKREQDERWQQIYEQILLDRQQAPHITKLVYADFTNCKERLDGFVIVQLPLAGRPSVMQSDPIKGKYSRLQINTLKRLKIYLEITLPPRRTISSPSISKVKPSTPSLPYKQQQPQPLKHRSRTPPAIPTTPPDVTHHTKQLGKPLSSSKTDLNVLLLGETGVGKSTFINAFVNYLKFNTLSQAEQGEPAVLIPVSFLLTVGDRFDEVIVQFGDPNPNENHERDGQSVTQQCKSYVFDLNDQYRLRLIDTPGVGDTRGIDQDMKNIDHILTYIDNLPHINAICLLLKPNTSRLNVIFRSCIHQLTSYVTRNGCRNIIFCFTNARATFYSPGDTGPVLQKMLADENPDIPYQKENTFCFDSESFRYLVARRCNVIFDDYQKQECQESWNTSVTESFRLLNFIQTRQPYKLHDSLSIRRVALDISMLARPLMETLRLIVYNWKLSEAKLIANQIVLSVTPIEVDLCTNCAQMNIKETGPFWIAQYQNALLRTAANQHCFCPSNDKQVLVEYLIQHQFVTEPAGLKNERWQSSFHNFLLKCDTLLYFLRQQDSSTSEDPFQPILDRFLAEENHISQTRNINTSMNRKVRDVLLSIKQRRQLNHQQLSNDNERQSIDKIYQIIKELQAIPTVQKQVDCIQTSRQIKLKSNEIQVQMSAIQNRTLARLPS